MQNQINHHNSLDNNRLTLCLSGENKPFYPHMGFGLQKITEKHMICLRVLAFYLIILGHEGGRISF